MLESAFSLWRGEARTDRMRVCVVSSKHPRFTHSMSCVLFSFGEGGRNTTPPCHFADHGFATKRNTSLEVEKGDTCMLLGGGGG